MGLLDGTAWENEFGWTPPRIDETQQLRDRIASAIRSKLVIKNHESIKYAVDEIIKIYNETRYPS